MSGWSGTKKLSLAEACELMFSRKGQREPGRVSTAHPAASRVSNSQQVFHDRSIKQQVWKLFPLPRASAMTRLSEQSPEDGASAMQGAGEGPGAEGRRRGREGMAGVPEKRKS